MNYYWMKDNKNISSLLKWYYRGNSICIPSSTGLCSLIFTI
ncbi:hypothetical protein BOVA711_4964 [Bacteroides ovatus]|nr:hypothetical protein BOVA711_4964 [Bacteroides ovatus]